MVNFMKTHSEKRRKKRRRQYSSGELNRLIDDLIHPLTRQKPELIILDTLLHGMVEQNPSETMIKFIRYNLPQIIEKIMKGSYTH